MKSSTIIDLSTSWQIKTSKLLPISIAALTSTLTACISLPDNSNRTISHFMPASIHTPMAQRFLPDRFNNLTDLDRIGKTGAYILYDGEEAFTARLALSEKSQQSIDAQYYIWHDDIAGRLLLNSMYQAAERGVRIRLLLDDNSTKGMDELLTNFDEHPNIEVRLFNPYAQRKYRSMAYFTDTVRINRRMHNKSFTVDGVMSIIGGRNIGDEYFQAGNGLIFADLDVSVVGKVVTDIQQDFDRYWASESSYPVKRIAKPIKAARVKSDTIKSKQENLHIANTRFKEAAIDDKDIIINGNDKQIKGLKSSDDTFISLQATNTESSTFKGINDIEKTKDYLLGLFDSSYPYYLEGTDDSLEVWSDAYFFSDPPDKVQQARNFNYKDSVLAQVMPFIASSERQVLIISPYFIPTKEGSEYLIDMVKQGKRVVVMTNSLASTDVGLVHGAYSNYRNVLLEGGVELYEFKPDPKNDQYDTANYKKKYKDDYDINGILPNSNASLHAKAFTIDDKYFFVGSPNLDPRSTMLNSELGIVFDSVQMAKAVNTAFDQNKDIVNYKLKLAEQGKLEWHTIEEGKPLIYYYEPHAKLKDKVMSGILSMLPIEGWL